MSERMGFAMVLLVAVASIASIVFLSGTPTGQVTVHPPSETVCKHVICAGHAPAYPLLDHNGYVIYHDEGNPVCVCPQR